MQFVHISTAFATIVALSTRKYITISNENDSVIITPNPWNTVKMENVLTSITTNVRSNGDTWVISKAAFFAAQTIWKDCGSPKGYIKELV